MYFLQKCGALSSEVISPAMLTKDANRKCGKINKIQSHSIKLFTVRIL